MKTILITVSIFIVVIIGIVLGIKWNNNHKNERGIGNSVKSGVDSSGAKIYQFPYGFDNVAEKCDDRGNLLIITSNANTTSFVQIIPEGCK